jgi:hypothetical protein
MTQEQKIIRMKVGLLELAKQLGHASQSLPLEWPAAIRRARCRVPDDLGEVCRIHSDARILDKSGQLFGDPEPLLNCRQLQYLCPRSILISVSICHCILSYHEYDRNMQRDESR